MLVSLGEKVEEDIAQERADSKAKQEALMQQARFEPTSSVS